MGVILFECIIQLCGGSYSCGKKGLTYGTADTLGGQNNAASTPQFLAIRGKDKIK